MLIIFLLISNGEASQVWHASTSLISQMLFGAPYRGSLKLHLLAAALISLQLNYAHILYEVITITFCVLSINKESYFPLWCLRYYIS